MPPAGLSPNPSGAPVRSSYSHTLKKPLTTAPHFGVPNAPISLPTILVRLVQTKTKVNDNCEPVEDTDTGTDLTPKRTPTRAGTPLYNQIHSMWTTTVMADQKQGDCDDTTNIYTEAEETCDGVDNNCSGDESDAIDPSDWFEDADGDTFGNAAVSTQSCEPPEGYVDNDLDCNDQDASSVAPQTWYPDTDQDGLGDPTVSTEDCQQPSGTVNNGDDCDDTNAEIGVALTWYSDADEDGLGDPNTLSTTCTPPSDSVDNGDDCDDTDPKSWGLTSGTSTWIRTATVTRTPLWPCALRRAPM